MSQSIVRFIFRWIHIVSSIPILGYIYSPFEEIPKYAPAVRRIFVPIMVVVSMGGCNASPVIVPCPQTVTGNIRSTQ
jgi:hypothetical protein